MQLNRFWGSVWSVIVYLFSLGLLQVIFAQVATLFGLLQVGRMGLVLSAPGTAADWGLVTWLLLLVAAVTPIIGSMAYLDWRWSWKLEHVGMGRNGRVMGWAALGLLVGLLSALLIHGVSGLLQGNGAFFPRLQPALDPNLLAGLLLAPGIELVYRGVVVSRYEADLDERWQVLLAAALTPLAWMLIGSFFGLGAPATGMGSPEAAAMSLTLVLLFMRTSSAWLTTGIRMGLYGSLLLLGVQSTPAAGLLVWGVAAIVLLLLEWFRWQRMPRRVQPRRGPQRVFRGGRTVRGPWGPH